MTTTLLLQKSCAPRAWLDRRRSALMARITLVAATSSHRCYQVMDSRLRGFYDYQRTLMEPWDGPAALAFTDGRTVAATLDRNGLRPMRYWLTSAGKLIAGSEVRPRRMMETRIMR